MSLNPSLAIVTLAVSFTLASAHADGQPDQEPIRPTLEQITAEPDWIARSPENARWLVDGSGIIYSQRRPGKVGRDFSDDYLLLLSEPDAEAVKITPENPGPYLTARGDWDDRGEQRIVPHGGDLFLYDADGQTTYQLTRTRDREGSGQFMSDGERVMFTRGGDWYIRSESQVGAVELQAADVRFEDKPEDPKEKREEKSEKRDHLQKQQRELFEIIRLDDEREAMREDDRFAWRDTDPTDVPGPFWMGKDRRSMGSWLSPGGEFMLVATAPKERKDGKNDLMPSYVTESGYVTTSRVRTKVGLQPETPVSFALLDLEGEEVIELPLDALSTITEDPLAWLKEKNAEGSGEDESDGDEEGEEQEENAEEKEPEARAVSSMGVRWSDSGRYGAFMVKSHDNKDRWIVMVDTEGDEIEPIEAHHLRDEAWINWSFNDFGFVPDSDTLWYLSEESGYGHLYTYEPGSGERAQRTEGDFEVRSVEFTRDGSLAYMRTNRAHPGMQELERLDLATGELTPVTDMDGTVESYEIAPGESLALVRFSDLDSPPELYLIDLTGSVESPKRLTHTVTKEFLRTDLQPSEIIPIPSSHVDHPIYTRVYIPDAERFEGPRPIVIFSHGAGYTQHANYEWPYYFREHMFHTILANEGFIVLAPDFRASEGYGRDWRTAVYRKMGYPELEDFKDTIDWAAEEHGGDPERVGIYGGSYGGFMTLMAMFLEPETYKAGAALRSVTDWRHYNHGYTSNILNTPQVDPEAYDISSPINHAEGLEGHLLMLHGLLDDNVVAQDVIRLSQRLIELEKQDWELMLHPVEPHGYKEPSSWLDQMRRIHGLFDRVLNQEEE